MRKKTKLPHLISMLLMVLTLAVLMSREPGAQAAVLHDNGPMVNSPGTHPGGGDESIMREDVLGLTTYGFNNSHNYVNIFTFSYAVSDNFTIPAGTTWSISSVDFFAFQQDAAAPTITAAYLQIWNGKPGSGASGVRGDNTTNVQPSVAFTDTYIVLNTPGQTDDSRRVQRVTITTDNLTLGPGTYWAAWSCDDYGANGNRQYQPPIRIDNQTTTGDALVYAAIIGIGAWGDAQDAGTGTGQDFPFIVTGGYCTDKDGDGYGEGALCAGPDCNDNDSEVHALFTYYRDADGDGYGNQDNATALCGISSPPAGYVDNSSGFDVDDTDPFYTDFLPTCDIKIIPKTLGRLIGDKEKTRFLLVIGKRGMDFGDNPLIKWESDAIDVVSTRVLFKRFMFMRAKFNGEPLDKRGVQSTCRRLRRRDHMGEMIAGSAVAVR